MFQLQRIADNDGAARAKQQRQRGSDVALAGFVDHHQIEKRRLKRQPSARRKSRDRPTRQYFRHLGKQAVITAKYFPSRAFIVTVAAGDHLQQRQIFAQQLTLFGKSSGSATDGASIATVPVNPATDSSAIRVRSRASSSSGRAARK